MKRFLLATALALLPVASLADSQGIEVRDGFTRATLPNAPVAGGFLSIVNHGDTPDRLIAARADFAGAVEIHEMTHEGDVMRMRELPDGLALPPGARTDLTVGGYHLMFLALQRPLVLGETVEAVLTFERAGEITVPLAVRKPNARSYDDDGSPRTAPAAAGGHSH